MEFSSNLSAIYTKWCAQTFPSIFGLFAIFDCNFATIVAPPSDEYENEVVRLKELSLLKKSCKTRRNRPINGNAMLVRTMHRSTAQCSGLLSVTKKQTHFHTYSRHALHDLPQTLYGDRARRGHQKRCHHFSIQRIVFPTGCTEKIRPNLPTRGFSAITL